MAAEFDRRSGHVRCQNAAIGDQQGGQERADHVRREDGDPESGRANERAPWRVRQVGPEHGFAHQEQADSPACGNAGPADGGLRTPKFGFALLADDLLDDARFHARQFPGFDLFLGGDMVVRAVFGRGGWLAHPEDNKWPTIRLRVHRATFWAGRGQYSAIAILPDVDRPAH